MIERRIELVRLRDSTKRSMEESRRRLDYANSLVAYYSPKMKNAQEVFAQVEDDLAEYDRLHPQ